MGMSSAVGSFNTGTGAIGTTVAVSGLGFQPKLVLFWWSNRTGTTDAAGRADAGRGFGYAISTSVRGRCNTLAQDTPTSMVTNKSQDDTECIGLTTTADAIDGLMDLQSMDADGFTLVVDDVFVASYRVHYLALGGTDITDVAGGNFLKATVTGDQDITSVGFEPDLVILFSHGGTNLTGTIAVDTELMIGAFDGNGNQAVYLGASNDAAGTSQTLSYCTDAECAAIFANAITITDQRAQFTSMLSNGFRINWIDNAGAVASAIQYIALKGGSYKVGSLLTQTDTTTDIVASGFGFQPAAGMFLSHGKAESTADTPQDDDEWSMGAFSSTSARAAFATADDDAAGTAIVSSAVEHDEVYINLNANTGAVEGLMDIKSVDSGGFTCIMDDADPAQAFVWYIAFGPSSGPTEYTQSASGTLTSAGANVKQTAKSAAGTLGSAGSIVKQTGKIATGVLSSAGALVKQARAALVGTLTSSGAFSGVKTALLSLTGTLTSSGTLSRQAGRVISGAMQSSGALSRSTAHGLAGTLATAGALASVKAALLSLAGTLSSAGALSRQGQKASSGTLDSAGGLHRSISRALAGTLPSSGTLSAIRTILVSLSGALSSSGTLSRQIDTAVTGTLSSAGTIGRAISHALGGVLDAVGSLIASAGQLVQDLPYMGDAYRYDSAGGTGGMSGGSVQAGPNQSSPTGSIAGGSVQMGPNQQSPTGSIAGGTVLPPETIL